MIAVLMTAPVHLIGMGVGILLVLLAFAADAVGAAAPNWRWFTDPASKAFAVLAMAVAIFTAVYGVAYRA